LPRAMKSRNSFSMVLSPLNGVPKRSVGAPN
jgi:hypothetical protein